MLCFVYQPERSVRRAPSFGTLSPTASPRARRNASPSRVQALLNRPLDGGPIDEDELLNSRYNFLKQRNEALANRPGASLGPGVITTPPQPSAATLKDTSVNIASAFQQAAVETYAMNATSSKSNGQRTNVPRSTSVEYEEQSRSTSHRRLAVPPNRAGGRSGGSKPPSKVGSTARGSDAENEVIGANGRAKSPFDVLSDYARKAITPATEIFMKQRTPEPDPDEINIPSRQATDTTLVSQNAVSYDYADEEAAYQSLEKKTNSAAHKRNRMSTDNKAYRPTASDLEASSEEDDDDDERKGRRRKSKKKDVGGSLPNFPVVQYDKKKRRKARGDKGNGSVEEERSVSDEHVEQVSIKYISPITSTYCLQTSLRSTTPLQRQASVPRASAPPSRRGSVQPASSNTVDTSGLTDDSHFGSGLPSISEDKEAEEQSLHNLEAATTRRGVNRRARSSSRSRRTRRAFSIGGFLGSFVNLIIRLCRGVILFIVKAIASVTLGAGWLVGGIFNILVRQPTLYVRNARRRSMNFGKYFVMGILLCCAWYLLKNPGVVNFSLSTRPRPVHYTIPSDYPPGTVEALNDRILHLENMIADLFAESQSSLDTEKQKARDLMNRINQLEVRVDKEVIRAYQNEESSRVATSKNLENLHREILVLKTQSEESSHSSDTEGKDEEARKKLEALEGRLQSMEGEVKDALELGQSAVKAGSLAASAASGTHWWNKISSGSSSGITIKTGDGQDVTSLVEHLVEKSVAHHSQKDDIARVDFALNSAGAGVIPSLTSQTFNVQPKAFFGFISGAARYARSPVNALNHETQVGYCWPFFGSQGQLGVQLTDRVLITDVTIDHIAKEVAHDLRTTPRQMEVWGLLEGRENREKYVEFEAQRDQARADGADIPDAPEYPSDLPRSRDVRYVPIASFMYDIHASNNIQTFPVRQDIQDLGIDFGVVVLVVKSNWGSQSFTCLYRFRVHGNRAQEISSPDP